MKIKLVIVPAFIAILFFQCSKEGKRGETLVGEWTFRSKTVQIGPYPSMFSNGAPSSISTETNTSNEVRVSFSLDGNFTFFYYDKLPQSGQFEIRNDTLLVIQPDTSGFLKFCSFQSQIMSGPTLPPSGVPELKGDPISDTILIRKISKDEIKFVLSNLKKAQVPLNPSTDSLIYTEILSTFKRL